MGKRLAIVQSNYIPWKGYFDLMNSVDEFILLDDVQFTKNDWRNRNKIKTRQGAQWLTIPVKHRFPQKINETMVSDCTWNRKHWSSITHNYSKARYFETYERLFQDLYLGMDESFLSQVNYRFITAVCQVLGIDTTLSWSSDYELLEEKTERLIHLCQQVGATEYVSGPAAKAYIDEERFRQADIELTYADYSGYPEYDQLFPPFEHSLSIVDLILNQGPEASKYMKSFRSQGGDKP